MKAATQNPYRPAECHQIGDRKGIVGQYQMSRGFLYPPGPSSPANTPSAAVAEDDKQRNTSLSFALGALGHDMS